MAATEEKAWEPDVPGLEARLRAIIPRGNRAWVKYCPPTEGRHGVGWLLFGGLTPDQKIWKLDLLIPAEDRLEFALGNDAPVTQRVERALAEIADALSKWPMNGG